MTYQKLDDTEAETGQRVTITQEMIEAGIAYCDSVRAFVEPTMGSDEEVGEFVSGVYAAMVSAGKAPTRRF